MKHGHGDKKMPMKGWPMAKNYAHATGIQHSMSPARKMTMKKTKRGHTYG